MNKKVLKLIILIVVIYLLASSVYIFTHIDFREVSKVTGEVSGQGFSNKTNNIRIFMGLPETYSTYEGVPSSYMWQVVIKFFIAIVLIVYSLKKNRK